MNSVKVENTTGEYLICLEFLALTSNVVPVEEHQKALKKIETLEKTIDFLKTTHQDRIKGLHSEISRLQGLCAGNE